LVSYFFFFCSDVKKNVDDKFLLLQEIKANNVTNQTFEYSNGFLIKEKQYFAFCSTPVDEYVYTYQNGKLSKLHSTLRSMYSSTTALCNPAMGIQQEEQYEYDNKDRLVKVIRPSGYSTFEYNTQGHVAKQIIYLSNGTITQSLIFSYDSRGNIVKEVNSQGNETNYQYDNKKNPFYYIKQKPGWISAFNTSPNNVIKATSTSGGFERKIVQYINNFPQIVEESGVSFTFIYQ
jgi:YD repeat-containing protein